MLSYLETQWALQAAHLPWIINCFHSTWCFLLNTAEAQIPLFNLTVMILIWKYTFTTVNKGGTSINNFELGVSHTSSLDSEKLTFNSCQGRLMHFVLKQFYLSDFSFEPSILVDPLIYIHNSRGASISLNFHFLQRCPDYWNSIRQSTAALSEGFTTNTTTIKFKFKHSVTFKLCSVVLLANIQINFNHKKNG